MIDATIKLRWSIAPFMSVISLGQIGSFHSQQPRKLGWCLIFDLSKFLLCKKLWYYDKGNRKPYISQVESAVTIDFPDLQLKKRAKFGHDKHQSKSQAND